MSGYVDMVQRITIIYIGGLQQRFNLRLNQYRVEN